MMKRLVLFAILMMGVSVLGVIHDVDAAGKKVRVAVFDFENNSQWHWWGDNLGRAAGDVLTTQLVKTGEFTVIEREKLQAILAEQGLGASGAVSSSTAPQIGKLLGVQLIFTGSITAFSIKTTSAGFGGIGGSYTKAESKMDVRMINTETGEIMLVAEGKGDKKMGGARVMGAGAEQHYDQGVASEALRPACEDVVEKVMAQKGLLAGLAPASGAGKVLDVKGPTQVYIEGGSDSAVSVGDVYAVFRVTDEIKDEDGNVLDSITEKVGEIVVTKVLSKSAICETRSGSVAKGDLYRKE